VSRRAARVVRRLKQSRIPSGVLLSTGPLTPAEREAIAQQWVEARRRPVVFEVSP
jgi:hypothetical protein